ncbi:hypothetical protein SAMN06297358_1878 [Pedobacter xixiisoli]|uniref:Uncharacterized protein n=1 Tax=Pedobacter xixiisoli TaxID=1476464 RepID=A0A285ZZ41_9SPHI|nr:hypothetical protein [Pedobacter xixiisoli]SOD14914.1 hypothetical protein SAMN06297358_1878 [Pedobacter xixiisoli]
METLIAGISDFVNLKLMNLSSTINLLIFRNKHIAYVPDTEIN